MPVLSDEMKRVVDQQRLAYIATVSPDGTPNLSPKGTIRVWDDQHLIFADICSPGTINNLRHNPAIEINVVDTFSRKGYRFKGKAAVVTEGQVYQEAMRLYTSGGQGTQHGVSSLIRGFVVVEVAQAQPVISPGYTPGVTEEQMRQQWQGYYNSLQPPVT